MRSAAGFLLALGAALALVQCQSRASFHVEPPRVPDRTASWDVVYQVLQHPRCVNCHPSGNAPLLDDAGHAHAPEVRRGQDGRGLVALRCETCHLTRNQAGAHLPPGAPDWRMPRPELPLVFQGRSSGQLCRQLKDPSQNGGRTPAQLLQQVTEDALVDWGWDPGEGRTPIPIPRTVFVEAVRAWIKGGCGCPE